MKAFVKNYCGIASHSSTRRQKRRGISRPEALITVVCLLVAATFAIPYLLQSQSATRRTRCEQRLITLGKAMHRMEAIANSFPGYCNEQVTDATGTRRATGWAFPLLPYFEDDAENPSKPFRTLFNEYSATGESGQRGERPVVYLADFVCPATGSRTAPILNYVANCGMPDATSLPYDWPANGVFLDRFRERPPAIGRDWIQARDGEATTLMFSENVDAGQWTDTQEAQVGFVWRAHLERGEPVPGPELLSMNQERGKGDRSLRFARPSSHHGTGVNCLFVGGQTEFLSERIDYLVLVRLMTPDDTATTLPGSQEPAPVPYRMETGRQGDGETRRRGDKETGRQGDGRPSRI